MPYTLYLRGSKGLRDFGFHEGQQYSTELEGLPASQPSIRG